MITVEVDDKELLSGLSALRSRLSSSAMRRVMSSVAGMMRESIAQSFESMSSPDGKPWQPLAYSTRMQRLRKYKSRHFRKGAGTGASAMNDYGRAALTGRFEILRNTSALLNSLQGRGQDAVTRITADEVVIGTKRRYAAVHQFGGKAGRGRKVTIPARPYMGISASGKDEIMAIIRRHLEAA